MRKNGAYNLKLVDVIVLEPIVTTIQKIYDFKIQAGNI